MSQQSLLRKVIQRLENSGIEYMITGSIVSSLQGEPRSTHDIDVVIAIERNSALAKLRWTKLCGGSEKHFTDAIRVFEVQYAKLDTDYLEKWANQLKIESLWKKLKDEAVTI